MRIHVHFDTDASEADLRNLSLVKLSESSELSRIVNALREFFLQLIVAPRTTIDLHRASQSIRENSQIYIMREDTFDAVPHSAPTAAPAAACEHSENS